MKYEELQWERQNECRWRAKAPSGYEIVWEIRDDGIAVLHGQPPATGGAIRMKSTADGIARVKVALELIDKELSNCSDLRGSADYSAYCGGATEHGISTANRFRPLKREQLQNSLLT